MVERQAARIPIVWAFAFAILAGPAVALIGTFTGTLAELNDLAPKNGFYLRREGGSVELPARPSLLGKPAALDATVTVSCNYTVYGEVPGGAQTVRCLDMEVIEVGANPAQMVRGMRKILRTAENTTGVSIRYLVMVAYSSCGYPISRNASDVRNDVLRVADRLRPCSYGKMRIDTRHLQVVEVDFTCEEAEKAFAQCDVEGATAIFYMQDVARQLARQQLGNTTFAKFTHFGVVVPQGVSRQCQEWAGKGDIGSKSSQNLPGLGPSTWYSGKTYGIQDVGTVLQELLHNFGLMHANAELGVDSQELCECHWNNTDCGSDPCHEEYGDSSSCMGDGDVCPNALELYALGWSSSIAILNSTTLCAASPKTLTIPATRLTSKNVVILRPDWLPDYKERGLNLYFSLRTRGGGDKRLLDEFDGKLSVHLMKASEDERVSNDDGGVHLVDVVEPDSIIALDRFNLLIKTSELYDYEAFDELDVTFCRYENTSGEVEDWMYECGF